MIDEQRVLRENETSGQCGLFCGHLPDRRETSPPRKKQAPAGQARAGLLTLAKKVMKELRFENQSSRRRRM